MSDADPLAWRLDGSLREVPVDAQAFAQAVDRRVEEIAAARSQPKRLLAMLGEAAPLLRIAGRLEEARRTASAAIAIAELIEDGRAQVTGFYLPGELLGIDAISSDKHPCSAEALETSEVCEIPFPLLEDLAAKIPGLQHQLLRIMSREIVRDEEMLMLLGRMTAEERLASCLMSFSRRLERLGGAPEEFKLSMSRQDLGDYLGLALETVSRLLSRFHDEGLIRVHGRQITLCNMNRLKSMAAGSCRESNASA